MDTNTYEPIEDHGVIGNLHTMALVSLKGTIDYLPFMRIDSPTIFLGILDNRKGGHFSIHPQHGVTSSKQFYLTGTNILVTRFHTETGIAEVTDFMPVSGQEFHCAVIRQVKVVTGTVSLKMECRPAFNYARSGHAIKQDGNAACLFIPEYDGQTAVRLTANTPVTISDNAAVADFTLTGEETRYFLLEAEHSTRQRTDDVEAYLQDAFNSTHGFWEQWISKCTYKGPWKEKVLRSALVLKLLVSHKYGSPVAAATFGLPEAVGGERNWDYRYTWIRDAAFTMYVFMELGFYDEADKFLEWVQGQCCQPRLQPLYAVDGNPELPEVELRHLEGYKASQPVRVGNAAYTQYQADVYGELLHTVHIFVTYARPISIEFWEEITRLVNYVIDNWRLPGQSIWEVRGRERAFFYSKVMCWVAVDRAIKIAEQCSFPYPLLEWRKARDEIYAYIFANFWNKEKAAFVQYRGAEGMDASTLLVPLVNFLSPYSNYWRSALSAIQARLVSDVLVYRYRDDEENMDALGGREGAFTICSFWYVECLAKGGETDKAMQHFEKMLGYGNHLGLYAEQIGVNGQHLGNFPQALTHLALISAAIELNRGQHLRKKVLPPEKAPKMT